MHRPRGFQPPQQPTEAEQAARRADIEAQRAARAAERPSRLAVLAAGPELRDKDAAADCPCTCHPQPASARLHSGGATCPCQQTPAERSRPFQVHSNDPDTAQDDSQQQAEADVAAAAVTLGVSAEVCSWEFPLAITGVCDGHSFYIRSRWGSWRVMIAPDPAVTDLYTAPAEAGVQIAAGQDSDLADSDGNETPAAALRVAIDAVRLSILRNTCLHEPASGDSHRFCRVCGVELTDAEAWRWPSTV